jgi:hypothetical protein
MTAMIGISDTLEQTAARVLRLEVAVGAILELCDEHDWDAIGEEEGRRFKELRDALELGDYPSPDITL